MECVCACVRACVWHVLTRITHFPCYLEVHQQTDRAILPQCKKPKIEIISRVDVSILARKRVGLSPRHLSVCASVRKVYCGKTADWIKMPFGVVSGVGRGMGVLDGGGDRRRAGAALGEKWGIPL